MTDFTKVLGQAYIDMLEAKKKKMDPVNKSELSGEFDDREDQDIDNDGDSDSSDKYLHKKRQTVTKAVEQEKGKKAMEESVVMTEETHETDESKTFAAYAGYKLREKWEVVQENEDGTFDAFINGELYTNIDEEKAKEIKHKNVAAVQPEGQEKLDQKDETGKQMADDMRKNMDTIDNPETAKQDGANMSQAPKRGGENRSNEPMKSVAKTQGQ